MPPAETIDRIESLDQALTKTPDSNLLPTETRQLQLEGAKREFQQIGQESAALGRQGDVIPPTELSETRDKYSIQDFMAQAPKDANLNLGKPIEHYTGSLSVVDAQGKEVQPVSYGDGNGAGQSTQSDAKLQGYVSNVPEVSKPISSPEDANKLVSGAAQAGMEMIQSTVAHLSEKGAVERDLLSIGPAMDKYTNHPEQLGRDAGYVLQAALDHLDKPMSPETRGHDGAAMSPWFIGGFKNPVSEAKAAENANMTVQELRAARDAGVLPKGVEWVPKEYRDAFLEAHPQVLGHEAEIQVHHRIPQDVLAKYPEMFSANEINSVRNLQGIPIDTGIHQTITDGWRDFIRNNANATKQQVLDFADAIDKKYGDKFVP